MPRIIATILIAIGLIYGASFAWHNFASRNGTGTPFATQSVNDLTVKLSSSNGQLKNGDNDVLIEFRDSRGQLIEVGNVKFEINMNMPGMQMHEGVMAQRAGTAGRYRAEVKVGMAGDWTAKLSYEARAAANKPPSTSTLNPEAHRQMKTKLLPLLPLTALTIAALEISPLAFAQTEVPPMLTPTPAAQATPSSQMQGMPGMYADAT